MSDNAFARSRGDAPTVGRPRALDTILYGGLVVGVLDILYAFTFWWLKGVGPVRILQSVASGLLGASSYTGGAKTAALGGVLHFLIALAVAAVYYAAASALPTLIRHPFVSGIVYGVAVYFFLYELRRHPASL